MLKILLDCNDQSAIFKLPYHYLEVEEYLLSAGFRGNAIALTLLDNDDPGQVQAKLITGTAADLHLAYLFPDDARLSTVNIVCDLFYNLPVEQQADLINDVIADKITTEKDLINAIKEIKAAESPHDLPAIVFSRVRLWTDNGEQCEFFMSGVPKSYDDIEDHEDVIDFKEFLKQTPDADMEGITAYITTFTEGDGEPQPASQNDIDRIYNVIADTDIDVITGWNMTGENSFVFDYDIDEQPGMTGIK